MKTLLFIFLIYFGSSATYSQSTYYPLIETGKTWHVVEGGFGANFITYTYKVDGDTLINQVNFKILYLSNEEFPVNWTKYGYIREDETKKVYYISCFSNITILNDPALLYDFSTVVGDTLTITSFAYNIPYELEIVISGIDSVLIDDEYRRKIIFSCDDWISDNNFWIEGIGSNNGLIETGFYCYIVCPAIELLCVKEGGNVIFHHDYYEGCYIVGIEENNFAEKHFLVHPNPAKDNIYITPQTNEGSDLVFILYNLESDVVFRKRIINFNQLVVNTNKLKEGLYLYRIIDNYNSLQIGKIIIKK